MTLRVRGGDFSYEVMVDNLIAHAKTTSNVLELMGEDQSEPYKHLKEILVRAVAELHTLINHSHQYDEENNYCSICGQDGRA